MSADAGSMEGMLDDLRAENVRSQVENTITVWKDGSHKVWRRRDAEYAVNDPEFLVNINLPVQRDPDVPEPSAELLAAYERLKQ